MFVLPISTIYLKVCNRNVHNSNDDIDSIRTQKKKKYFLPTIKLCYSCCPVNLNQLCNSIWIFMRTSFSSNLTNFSDRHNSFQQKRTYSNDGIDSIQTQIKKVVFSPTIIQFKSKQFHFYQNFALNYVCWNI